MHLGNGRAPVAPEDLNGQAEVASKVATPVALGEEWRTVFEARPRFERRCLSIVQPEMGHTGITQFMRIARLAEAFGVTSAEVEGTAAAIAGAVASARESGGASLIVTTIPRS